MPTVTWVGKPRRQTPGVYVVCRRNGFLGIMQCRGCRACGGDGYRRVATKRRGRKRGRGPDGRRRPKHAVRRGAWRLGIGAAFVGAGSARFGTIGAVVASVLVVAWLALTLVAWIAGPSSGSTRRRRRR